MAPAPGSLRRRRALARGAALGAALLAVGAAGCTRSTRDAAAASPSAGPLVTGTPAASAPPSTALPATAAPATAAPSTAPPSSAPPQTQGTPAPIVILSPTAAERGPATANPPAAAPKTAAPAPPTQIYSAVASPSVVHAGETVSWVVATTDDVTDVQASVSAYHFSLTRTGAGRFVLSFAIPPNVPPLFHGHYAVQLTAHGTSGSASGSLGVDFE